MKKLMMAATAAALLAGSSLAALAAEVNGSITSIDATAKTVTMDDGKIYTLPADFDAATLTQGEKVKLTVDDADGKTITKVEAAS